MQDVLLTQNCRITDDLATISMENVTIQIGPGNTGDGEATTLSANTVLRSTGKDGADTTTTLGESASVYSVYSNALDTVDVTGSSLTLDLSGLANQLDDYDYVAISFGESVDSLAHFRKGAMLP